MIYEILRSCKSFVRVKFIVISTFLPWLNSAGKRWKKLEESFPQHGEKEKIEGRDKIRTSQQDSNNELNACY